MTYLHIRGLLAENMVYRPRPGHESSRPERRSDGDTAFQLVLLDRKGNTLLSVAPQVTPRGCGHAEHPLRFRVRGSLPLHPEGKAYELRRGDLRLYLADIPSAAPVLAPPRCRVGVNTVTLRWKHCQAQETPEMACAPDQAAYRSSHGPATRRVTYSVVAAMESGRRITVARGLTETTHTVDLSLMPVGGKGKLFLIAGDGVRSSEVEASSIDVPMRAPTLHILLPAPDARVAFGRPISVLGCLLDMGGQPLSPGNSVWRIDGERFAAGTLVAALSDLKPGTHRLTFTFELAEAARTEASVSIEVEQPDAEYLEWEALMDRQAP